MRFRTDLSYRILCLLCAIPVLFLLLLSCGHTGNTAEILSYQSKCFTASIKGELYGAPFEGMLTHTVSPDHPDTNSDTFLFTSPHALAGITLTVHPQKTTVSLDGICIDDNRWNSLTWTKITKLFALEGAPLSVTSDRDKNEMTVIYQTDRGEAYTIILDSNSERPKWIEGDGIWIEILSFT